MIVQGAHSNHGASGIAKELPSEPGTLVLCYGKKYSTR
jgi:hypothetical protein